MIEVGNSLAWLSWEDFVSSGIVLMNAGWFLGGFQAGNAVAHAVAAARASGRMDTVRAELVPGDLIHIRIATLCRGHTPARAIQLW